ncbi:MAG TPA: BON domain-containing protein [Acidimicrobiales bacterium]|nr:BON domain-containing protein [Acidimicrobiales bacterium]
MKTGIELRREIEPELEREPSVDQGRIGVSVVDGVATLTGEVSSYAEKWNTERAVERVAGGKTMFGRGRSGMRPRWPALAAA